MAAAIASNPSLGTLDRLPAEIRNEIYELVIHSPNRETRLLGRCAPNTSLAFVSKQVSREAMVFIDQYHQSSQSIRTADSSAISSCQHASFTLTVRKCGLKEKFEAWSQQSSSRRHQFDKPSFTVKFITGHLSKYAPTSITVKIRLRQPEPKTIIVRGNTRRLRRPRYETSIDGGHICLNQILQFEMGKMASSLRDRLNGKGHDAQIVVESLLLQIAEVLNEKCLDGKNIVTQAREKARRYEELRNTVMIGRHPSNPPRGFRGTEDWS